MMSDGHRQGCRTVWDQRTTVSRRSLIPDHPRPALCSSEFVVVSLPVISTRCHEKSYKKPWSRQWWKKERHMKKVTAPPCYGLNSRKRRLKQGETEPTFERSLRSLSETWQRDGVNNVELKTTSSYLGIGTPKLWGTQSCFPFLQKCSLILKI